MVSNDYVFTDDEKINSAINFYIKNKNTDLPIIIPGKNGSGKTHILKSFQNYYQTKNDSKTIYISAEAFKNEFIESIKKGTTDSFRKKYRNLDVLLIDDFEILKKCDATLQELCFTFYELLNKKASVFISTTCTLSKGFIPKLKTLLKNSMTLYLPSNSKNQRFVKVVFYVRNK